MELTIELREVIVETYYYNAMLSDYEEEIEDGANHEDACAEVLDRVTDWLQGDGNYSGDFKQHQKELEAMGKMGKRAYKALAVALWEDADLQ